ncbi:MAG: alpha-hydroxy acid oxidase, partial [Gammaproteobacteria bacterium]
NQAHTCMIASMMANRTLEEIAAAAQHPLWFQLFVLNSREATLALIRRAEHAKCKALVITVDGQYLGKREADLRNNFELPSHLQPANLLDQTKQDKIIISARRQDLFLKSLSWDDIAWIRKQTNLPILLKGILHQDDARMAIEHDCNGIIISNHGGRQLDTAVPPICVLPDIVDIIANKIPILLDGGIRRGTDILKAIALGADAVLIGRPILWGLAVNGAEGASHVLKILRDELSNAMALCGFTSIMELKAHGRSIIYYPTT